ncbi:hypothetical protein [Parashewanella spongiae]|nr:hypothetical protein [Parashewanella spongiae]
MFQNELLSTTPSKESVLYPYFIPPNSFELHRVQQELTSQKTHNTFLGGEITRLEIGRDKLMEQIEELQSQIQHLTNKPLEEKAKQLKEDNQNLSSQIVELKSELSRTKSGLVGLLQSSVSKKEADELKGQVKKLERELSDARSIINSRNVEASNAYSQLKQKLQTLEQAKTKAESDVRKVQVQYQTAAQKREETLANLQLSYRASHKKVEELDIELSQKSQEACTMQKQLENTISAQKKEIQALKSFKHELPPTADGASKYARDLFIKHTCLAQKLRKLAGVDLLQKQCDNFILARALTSFFEITNEEGTTWKTGWRRVAKLIKPELTETLLDNLIGHEKSKKLELIFLDIINKINPNNTKKFIDIVKPILETRESFGILEEDLQDALVPFLSNDWLN